VFALERPEQPAPLYRFRMVQAEPGVLRTRGGLRVQAHGGLALLQRAHTIVVPGWRDVEEPPPEALLQALRRAHARGARLLSICSGAFVLAAAGLLDGRAATTHWRYAQRFQAMHPRVQLRPDVLYVDHGDVITSAGSAAGIDACLHLVRKDHGAEAANLVARTMVTPPQREGSQAQFVPRPVPREEAQGLAPVMDWARAHLARDIRVQELARKAGMSERSFLRHFRQQAGMRPKEWLRRQRVLAAQDLLEKSAGGLEDVAGRVGFGSAEAMRQAFRAVVGAPPSRFRAMFGGRPPG
jgi:AraC family transcriptional activator FtrA